MAVMHCAFSAQYSGRGSGTKVRKLTFYAVFIYLIMPANSTQGCRDTVGSLDYSRSELPVPVDTTSILTGYIVPCNGTVIAWEFCYQISSASSMSIFPGIWRITGTINYELVQSSNITYDSRGTSHNPFRCRTSNLSNTDQFIVQAGSVVGLYTGSGQVLRTSENNLITTHQLRLNQTVVSNTGNNDVNYSIAIKVHLASISDNTATSIIPTSDTTIVTPTSTISTSDTTIVTLTSTISTSDTIMVIPTNSIVSTSDTTTVTPANSIASTSNTTTISPTTISDTTRIVIVTTTHNNGSSDIATSVRPSTISDGSNSNGNTLDSAAIVIGAMGGVIFLLLMIPIVICAVVFCMRKHDRKLTYPNAEDHMHHTTPPKYLPAATNINLICNNNVTQCSIQRSHSGNTNPSHGESTEQATTSFNVTSDKSKYESLNNNTTGEYNYNTYAQNHLLSHHDMPAANSSDDVEENCMASADQGNQLAQPNDKNGVYGVIRQRKCDSFDNESTNVSTDGTDNPSAGSGHNTHAISLISAANLSIDANSLNKNDFIKYGVVTLLRSDNQNL